MLYEYLKLVGSYDLLNIIRKGADVIEMHEIKFLKMVFKLCIFDINTLCLMELYRRMCAQMSAS
jgi:hypothetical protein